MPRTVLVAIIGCAILGALGLASFVHGALGLADQSSLTSSDWAWLVLQAVGTASAWSTVRGLVRRRDRARVGAFAVGLAMAFSMGVVGLVGVVSLLRNAGAAEFLTPVHVLVTFAFAGLSGAIPWSLARPSAKTWFASASPGDRVPQT